MYYCQCITVSVLRSVYYGQCIKVKFVSIMHLSTAYKVWEMLEIFQHTIDAGCKA